METITFKLQEEILNKIDRLLTHFNFSTRTEFIRDAIRDKLERLDTEIFMKKLAEYKGAAKVKHTDEEFRKIREKAAEEYFKELEKKFK